MGEWADAGWARDCFAAFLPALLFFTLIRAYRTLRWLTWLGLLCLAGLFVYAYKLSGYPQVFAELASGISGLGSATIAGLLAAWLLRRPALKLARKLGERRRQELLPPERPVPGIAATPSPATRAIAVVAVGALLAPSVPAFAATPEDAWRALLPLNQIVLDRALRPVCHCGLPLTRKDVPRVLMDALVAVEDRRFYIHRGIDPLGMLRALRALVIGGNLQGGSTISQQLAKFSLLSEERTLLRKGQDVVWGLRIDAAMAKDEILLLYLNRAIFGWAKGRPIVGVEQASRQFFGKRARDLTLYEAASLAGLVNAPLRLDPKRAPGRLKARARLVLRRMVEQGFVERKQAAVALKAGIRRGGVKPFTIEPRYFAEWAMEKLKRFEPAVEPAPGLRLFVTLDSRSQLNAEAAVRRSLGGLGGRHAEEGALVAMDLTGRVNAMAGGKDFARSQFNRAVKARRQPASAFKPFVYLAALEQGMRPETRILDVAPERLAMAGKMTGPFHGLMTFEEALSVSANGAAVRLADKVGLANVAGAARKLGIASPLRADRSLALGTSEVTLIELTSAFAPFANAGLKVRPHGVLAVVERGRVRHIQESVGARVIEKRTASGMRRMLRAVVAQGTGRLANISADAAGKTGTSQENRDAWFVGFAGGLVAGLWLGNDDHSPMAGVTGSEAAAAWAHFAANELAR